MTDLILQLPGGRCWATDLGECQGPLTKEHLLTDALFGGRVRVESEGAPWVPGRSCEVPMHRLQTNILCRGHNSELGRTADAAALRLRRALRQALDPTALPGATEPRAPVARRINGAWYGRWLCKTHCNLMVAAGLSPAPEYVRYAFGKDPGRHVYFYAAGLPGDTLNFAEAESVAVHYVQFVCENEPGFDSFELTLGGFPTLVSLHPLRRNDEALIDRVLCLRHPTPLGTYEITFDWSYDPNPHRT